MKFVALVSVCLLLSSPLVEAASTRSAQTSSIESANRLASEIEVAYSQSLELERDIGNARTLRNTILAISIPLTLYNALRIHRIHQKNERLVRDFELAWKSKTPPEAGKHPFYNQVGFILMASATGYAIVFPSREIVRLEFELIQVRARLAASLRALRDLAGKQ